MSQQTSSPTKACYLTINQLCDKINDATYDNEKKQYKNHKETSGLYLLLISNDNIYDDKFNRDMAVCKPKALSIYDKEYMDYKELCKLLNCDKLYVKINKRHIEVRNSTQIIEIESVPEEFTNKEGDVIYYHNTNRLTGIFYKNVVKEYQKYIASKSTK